MLSLSFNPTWMLEYDGLSDLKRELERLPETKEQVLAWRLRSENGVVPSTFEVITFALDRGTTTLFVVNNPVIFLVKNFVDEYLRPRALRWYDVEWSGKRV